MSRKWAPSGVSGFNCHSQTTINYTLSDDAQLYIQTTLQAKGVCLDKNIELLGVSENYKYFLNIAVKGYAIWEEFKETSKPAVIRKNLESAIKKSEIDLTQSREQIIQSFIYFFNAINSFDMTIKMLMESELGLDIHKHIDATVDLLNSDVLNQRSILIRMNKCKRILEKALALANEYPKKGRLPEYHKISFAADIAYILRKLGHTPTCKVSDLFEQLLVIILSDVHQQEFSNLHTLAEAALKQGSSGFSNI